MHTLGSNNAVRSRHLKQFDEGIKLTFFWGGGFGRDRTSILCIKYLITDQSRQVVSRRSEGTEFHFSGLAGGVLFCLPALPLRSKQFPHGETQQRSAFTTVQQSSSCNFVPVCISARNLIGI